MSSSRQRLLVLVVAYRAETTLESVLDRIPDEVFATYDAEILIIDDSSTDRTFEIGVRYSEGHRHRIAVLYNPIRLGYGANQKLGYAYAIGNGFDLVALLHGDGKYAPEKIPELVRYVALGDADAVLGSRMLTRWGALEDGMPLHRFLANRGLTFVQNRLLRLRLSEFHSGYRAYSVSALKRIPFQYNDNSFPFDTEMIIQLVMGGFRIKEVAIPNYCGDEIRWIAGLEYAFQVLRATILSRLHAINVFYDRKLDLAGTGNRLYDLKLGYRSSHTLAFDAVPAGSRVLDIGCGPGVFARELKAKGCRVTGMDRCAPTDAGAFEAFHTWDATTHRFDMDLDEFDVVLLLDIIEHLTQPEAFLDALRKNVRPGRKMPLVIITSGNVAFCVLRVQLLLGNFNYGKRGILDLTHTRLYTFATLRRLLTQCGYRIERVMGVPAPLPKVLGLTGWARLLVRLNEALITVAKGLFSYQIFMVATPLPTVEAFLRQSVAESEVKAARHLVP